MGGFRFELLSGSATGPRLGRMHIPSGIVRTPAFMTVGTQSTVKGLTSEEVQQIGAEMILANTFILYLRPGADVIERAGGLHRFMRWEGPILTDSGGFQILSLARLRRLTDEGVTFRSPLDGAEHLLTPERVLEIQRQLGSDLVMPLDVCLGYPADDEKAKEALRLTLQWARRSRTHAAGDGQMLFGIVQGGFSPALRREAAARTVEMAFDGYAIGGLGGGGPREGTAKRGGQTLPRAAARHPRHPMGGGGPPRAP